MSYDVQYALVRPLPESFALALTQHPPLVPIDVKLAQIQHENYSKALQKSIAELIVVDADEAHPDCCFIEDTAIVAGRVVIISRIGADSRRQESEMVADAFKNLLAREKDMSLYRLEAPATLDGGDVLQMGGLVFVGLSKRTNQAAIDQLELILPGKVRTVAVEAGLHLKSVLSSLDNRTLIAANHPAARQMGQSILSEIEHSTCIEVPDIAASNIVRAGHTLFIQDGFPESEKILRHAAGQRNLNVVTLQMSELIKADGALTCCSILIHSPE